MKELENLTNEDYVKRVNNQIESQYGSEQKNEQKKSAFAFCYQFLKDMGAKTKKTLVIGAIMFSAGAIYGSSHSQEVTNAVNCFKDLVGIEYKIQKEEAANPAEFSQEPESTYQGGN